MARKKLTIDQKSRFAEKIMDWGNIVFAGLTIAQIVPGITNFSWRVFFLGVGGLVFSYSFAYYLMKR